MMFYDWVYGFGHLRADCAAPRLAPELWHCYPVYNYLTFIYS